MSVIHNGSIRPMDTITFDQSAKTGSFINGKNTIRSYDKEPTLDPKADRTEKKEKFDLSKLSESEKESLFEELNAHNESFAYTGKYLKFRYDEEAETSYVEVINSSTQEVIVSLPPEFLIDLSVKMKKILGLFIDKKL